VIGYWSRLSASGDPNGDGALAWPQYEEASDQHMRLDLTLATGAGLKQEICDFWDGLKP
jgi:para-nitrobenzyl esterase